MNNSNLLFYIVVPVYKAENFIDKCIESVFNQSYKNWKLILVDDGSPDKSGEICDKYSSEYENIITIHQENKGQIAARTRGNKYILENIQPNSFVVYLDSDDTLEWNALEVIKNTVENDNSNMVIYHYQRVYPSGKIQKNSTNMYNGIVSDKRELYKVVFSSPYYNSLCVKSINTNLIEANVDYKKFYHLRHAEDLLQSIYYYKHCSKVSFINNVLYNYSFNENSVTNTINYNNYKSDTTIREYVWQFLESENIWSPKDYKEYSKKMQSILKSELVRISRIATTINDKIIFFDKLRKNLYWKKILSYVPSSMIILLFKLRQYRLIVSLVYLRDKIK